VKITCIQFCTILPHEGRNGIKVENSKIKKLSSATQKRCQFNVFLGNFIDSKVL
jgi:hypothetical protein